MTITVVHFHTPEGVITRPAGDADIAAMSRVMDAFMVMVAGGAARFEDVESVDGIVNFFDPHADPTAGMSDGEVAAWMMGEEFVPPVVNVWTAEEIAAADMSSI